jgi:hypothetical protein
VLDSLKGRGRVIWLSKGAIVDQPDLTTTAVLLDIGALDSVDYFADGELRCVVATEDTDKDALKAILWSNGFVEQDTEVASYTGCSKVDAAVVLGQFLMDKAQHVKLVIHRDRDYMAADHSEAFEHRLNQTGITPLLTDSNDVESYFLNADHLHFLNPTISAARIQELIDGATNELRTKSIAAIVNLRTEEAFRRRQSGGAPPNHGEIAVAAAADYEADAATMRRGKLVMNRVKSLLQDETGENPRIYFPSQHLKSERLSTIAATIWPPT